MGEALEGGVQLGGRYGGLGGQEPELLSPLWGRGKKDSWELLAPSLLERCAQCRAYFVRVERPSVDQDQEIDQILHARVHAVGPGKGVGVDLLGELQRLRDRANSGGRDAREPEEVVTDEFLGGSDEGVPEPDVDGRAAELLAAEAGHDGKRPAAERSAHELGGSPDLEAQEVIEVELAGTLECVAHVIEACLQR